MDDRMHAAAPIREAIRACSPFVSKSIEVTLPATLAAMTPPSPF
jgi:hypothetical protein